LPFLVDAGYAEVFRSGGVHGKYALVYLMEFRKTSNLEKLTLKLRSFVCYTSELEPFFTVTQCLLHWLENVQGGILDRSFCDMMKDNFILSRLQLMNYYVHYSWYKIFKKFLWTIL